MQLNNLFTKVTLPPLILISLTIMSTACSTSNVAESEVNQNCGEVSVVSMPPTTKKYYTSSIFRIDGKNVSTGRKTFKLDPGKHAISMFNHDGSGLRKLGKAGDVPEIIDGKSFEIEVKPNMIYHLSTEFISRSRVREQDRWKPVIWKTTEKKCLL